MVGLGDYVEYTLDLGPCVVCRKPVSVVHQRRAMLDEHGAQRVKKDGSLMWSPKPYRNRMWSPVHSECRDEYLEMVAAETAKRAEENAKEQERRTALLKEIREEETLESLKTIARYFRLVAFRNGDVCGECALWHSTCSSECGSSSHGCEGCHVGKDDGQCYDGDRQPAVSRHEIACHLFKREAARDGID